MRKKTLCPIDFQEDEKEVLREIEKRPAKTVELMMWFEWDYARIDGALKRLESAGKASKQQNGKWRSRVIQKELPLNSPVSRKGKGSGYVNLHYVNVKRNEARGKPPDACYYWHYSYTTDDGREIKRCKYLKNDKVQYVRGLIKTKTPWYQILKWIET